MKVVVAALAIALLALGWRLNSANVMLREQQQQVQTLKKALSERSAQEALALQTQCSEMAKKFLSTRGWKPGVGDDYKNHFNTKMNKCFVLVSSYLVNDDFATFDLYDAVEGKRYATYLGHNICDVSITQNPKKCSVDSGHVWLDGDDTRLPADFIAGFRGSLYGGGSGDATTQKTFLDHIKPFMTD